jgi:predicted nuclease with TOPRIM domain
VLVRKDPVLAEQAARLVALYRRLWESYVAKHADNSRLEGENHQLQLAGSRLTDEKSRLEHHCREQEARSSHFQEAFRKLREGVIELFDKWEDPKAELATADSAKGNKETGSHNVAAAVSSMYTADGQGPRVS